MVSVEMICYGTGLLYDHLSLAWLIPFSPLQAAGFGVAIAILGFAGDIIMSAIKRDAGIKDYGSMLGGHGGILDRIDGLALAAPVFFHLLRFYGIPFE